MTISPGEFLDHLGQESALFAATIAAVELGTPVPTCPGWTGADLLWHLTEVQWFWGTIVRKGIVDTEHAERLLVDRPDGADDLWALFRQASDELIAALAETPPDTPAWTWSTDQTVGFILRRQAHEALIHRVDAEVAGGRRTPLDARLAADGVDEALRVMYGETSRDDGSAPDPGRAVRVVSADTGHTWRLALGGADGDTFLQVWPTDDGAPVAAGVTAAAEDLNCWLWNRPATGPVHRTGDPSALAAVDGVLARGVQ